MKQPDPASHTLGAMEGFVAKLEYPLPRPSQSPLFSLRQEHASLAGDSPRVFNSETRLQVRTLDELGKQPEALGGH